MHNNPLFQETPKRRKSLPQDHTFCSAHSSSCKILHDLYSRLSERPPVQPAQRPVQHPTVALATTLPASRLPLPGLRALCRALDPPDKLGRDWCLLGVLLGLEDNLLHGIQPDSSGTEPEEGGLSPTARVVREWAARPGATLGQLLGKLGEMGREDAVDALLKTMPAMFSIVSTGRD